jgi:hypothetical protein
MNAPANADTRNSMDYAAALLCVNLQPLSVGVIVNLD